MGLTVKRVERLLRAGVPGKYTDGDVKGLMLCVEGKSSAHWLLRYQRDHKVRHLGLGGARDVPLASARAKARRERERIADGIDPLSVKRAERAAQRQAEARLLTFRQAAERCHAAREAGWSSAAHAAEFLSSLERWVYPHIGSLDVAAVGKDEVLRVLEQKLPNRMGKAESGGTFWTTKTITAEPIAKLPSGNWDSGSSRLAKIARRVFCKPALDHGAVDAMHWQFLDAARLCGVSSVSNWAAHGSRSDDQSQELIAGQRQDAEHQVA